MRKTILIPTDFAIESLVLVKHAITANEGDELRIILLSCSRLPDSIIELLFYSHEKLLKRYTSDEFLRACKVLLNEYPEKAKWIRLKIFHGQSQSAFDSFIDSEKISDAYIPRSYKLRLTSKEVDPVPFILKSNVKVHAVEWQETVVIQEKGQLAELYFALNKTK